MTATIQLSRDTHVYIGLGGASGSSPSTQLWKIPVLDGFSFSQATATTEVTLNEMQDANENSNRGRAMFTNALEPAEWSFSTYARPVYDNGDTDSAGLTQHSKQTAVEEVLWAFFFGAKDTTQSGAAAWNPTNAQWDQPNNSNVVVASRGALEADPLVMDSGDSDLGALGTFDLYFVLGGCAPGAAETGYSETLGQTIYKLAGCVVNTAGVDFDIDGITTINWSGFGATIEQLDASSALDFSANSLYQLGRSGVNATNNFLRNRITALTVIPDVDKTPNTPDQDQDGDSVNDFQASYDLILTGGSINMENNITFLTPEELCRVNTPIGHITGTRTVSGSFTCYLNDDGANKSAGFFNDLASATSLTRNKFNLKFVIGDIVNAGGVGLAFEFPTAHIDIPSHQIEDVISLETNFHALPSTLTEADEVTVTYKGIAPQ